MFSPITPKPNYEAVRKGIRPSLHCADGATRCTLGLSTPPTWSPDRVRAAKLIVAEVNARLLDRPVALPLEVVQAKERGDKWTHPECAALRAEALALLPDELKAHVVPYYITNRSPLVEISGPHCSFPVDINGTPLTHDGYYPYAGEDGSHPVASVNLAEYCDYYEFGSATALCGKTLAPLDLEWTLTDGTVDAPEPEIRAAGAVVEALSAGLSREHHRFGLLAEKAGNTRDHFDRTVAGHVAACAKDGMEWADEAMKVLQSRNLAHDGLGM